MRLRAMMFAMCGGALLSLAACSQEPATKAKTDAAPAATEETAAPETPAPAETAAAEPVALEITHNGAQMTGDPAAGERVFAQCRTCHSPEAGQNRTGPSLHGIIGRQAGTVPGFRYSNANRTSGITWTEQELFNYLENPRQRIPGTIMSFVGLRDAQQRADVIAYLKQTTSD